MENSRTCEICNVNVHRASFVKHLSSKKHLENMIQNEMIITEWFLGKKNHLLRKRYKKYITLKH